MRFEYNIGSAGPYDPVQEGATVSTFAASQAGIAAAFSALAGETKSGNDFRIYVREHISSLAHIAIPALGLTTIGQAVMTAVTPALSNRSAAWYPSTSMPGFSGQEWLGHLMRAAGQNARYLIIDGLCFRYTGTGNETGSPLWIESDDTIVQNCALWSAADGGSSRPVLRMVGANNKALNNVVVPAGTVNCYGISLEYASGTAEVSGNTVIAPNGSAGGSAIDLSSAGVAVPVKGNIGFGFGSFISNTGTAPVVSYNVSDLTISGGTGNVSGASAAAALENPASDARAKSGGPLAGVVTVTSGWVSTDASGTARTSNSATAGAFELAASGAVLAGAGTGTGTGAADLTVPPDTLEGAAAGTGTGAADLTASGSGAPLDGAATGTGVGAGDVTVPPDVLGGAGTGSGVGAGDLSVPGSAVITFSSPADLLKNTSNVAQQRTGTLRVYLIDISDPDSPTVAVVAGHTSSAAGLMDNLTGLTAGTKFLIPCEDDPSTGAFAVMRKVAS